MPHAFNSTTCSQLHYNITTLYLRRTRIGKLELTFEEYIQTFVPTEARQMFRDITSYVTSSVSSQHFELHISGSPVQSRVTLKGGSKTPPIPRNMVIQPDAPNEIIDRIRSWYEHGGDASRDFGRVSKLLTFFNENFSRVAIRYYWPTILAICSEGENTKHLVQELQELRTPVKLKSLPPGVAKACRQAAETIATARLIPTDAGENTETADVTISIVSGQSYNEEFGSFFGLN